MQASAQTAIIPSPNAAAPRTFSLQAAGLHCAACADTLADALRRLPGVRQVRVGYSAALVWIESEGVDLDALQAAAGRVGCELVPAEPEAAGALRRREARALLWRLFVAWFCMMQVMMLAAPSYFESGAEIPADLRRLLLGASWLLAVPVLLFAATPFLRGAWRGLRIGRPGMDLPVALGVLISFAVSSADLLWPTLGTAQYLDSMTMFVAFLLAARWLEMKARHAAAESLEGLSQAMPTTVQRVEADGRVRTVELAELRIDDVVQVALGEAIPVDGLLVQGRTRVDEALLSGESRPLAREVGDAVVAGSVNLGAPVRVRVQALGEQTRQAALQRLLMQALTERPLWAAEADRWAMPFLVLVLLLAAGAGALWFWLEPARAAGVVAAVLVVSCPCALALAAPAALVASARTLAARGVWLQRLPALERLAAVNHVVLDKTGTLTQPVARPEPGADARAVAAAVGLAQWSRHPLAQALARWPLTDHAARWREVVEHPGQGLRARDEQGRWWRLGQAAWLGVEAGDAALCFGAEDGGPRTRFMLDEQARADLQPLLRRLRSLGLRISLLSGDRPERVQALAAQFEFDDARGGASPEDKRDAVQALQAAGDCVLMLGDGVNDAPVLAQADVSVAMGEGALLARRGADLCLLHSDLSTLPDLVESGRRTRRVMRQNLAWALGYNLLAIPLAMSALLPPWAAGLGMALSSLLVVANALRLARD